uniref:Uncharacterized protein n=1 Tax=Panagrellus redivivus TaxID=6233 RepID=A0A7E4W7Y5_PANRE
MTPRRLFYSIPEGLREVVCHKLPHRRGQARPKEQLSVIFLKPVVVTLPTEQEKAIPMPIVVDVRGHFVHRRYIALQPAILFS